ncbi:hypothetical protein B296_00002287 [Ensete ventricosum]|uniref:Uncharacterized protein n=1 Tax=Ensete ventricosum TaxID=4639 RepID=A0A427BBU0_ENSVE|nr:hypothetical protein B296_00002287 [Ensete ventricosum]
MVERLRGILSSSQAIRDMTKIWLVEVSLNPVPWGTDSSYPYSSICTLSGAWSPRDKEHVATTRADPATGKTPCPRSMKDLCQMLSRSEGESFQALRMANLPDKTPSTPLEARWSTLAIKSHFWSMGRSLQNMLGGYLAQFW